MLPPPVPPGCIINVSLRRGGHTGSTRPTHEKVEFSRVPRHARHDSLFVRRGLYSLYLYKLCARTVSGDRAMSST